MDINVNMDKAQAVEKFRFGLCYLWAIANSRKSGLPIVVLAAKRSNREAFAHAGCISQSGEFIDVAGTHSQDEIRALFVKPYMTDVSDVRFLTFDNADRFIEAMRDLCDRRLRPELEHSMLNQMLSIEEKVSAIFDRLDIFHIPVSHSPEP